jgi:hypothetical protein
LVRLLLLLLLLVLLHPHGVDFRLPRLPLPFLGL